MKRVIVVVFDSVQTLDATGPAEVFAGARWRGKPYYQVEFASPGGGERVTSSSLRIQTRNLAHIKLRRSDTIVVAGGDDAAIRRTVADEALLRWLARAARRVERMASICSGAFLLAAAGILDGKCAATHWLACEQLASMFPRVKVEPNAIFVQDGRVWTSAGVTTGIDMALAIVEHDLDRATADTIAALLVLYVRRPGYQSQFSQALVAQSSGSDPLGPVLTWARANLANVDIDSFARRAGLSTRTLHRRCLQQLGTTPAKLLEKLRVEHARTLLTTSALATKALAAQCGFGNAARMQRAFQRELGMGPREYRLLHARAATPAVA